MIRSIFGDFPAFAYTDPVCDICSTHAADTQEARDAWTAEVKVDRSIKKQVDQPGLALNTDHFVIPHEFYAAWNLYLDKPSPSPELYITLCKHDKLDFDPGLDPMHYVTEAGWSLIGQK